MITWLRGQDMLALAALLLLIVAAAWPDNSGPACPHCGGGPVVPIIGGATACQSCARIVRRS
jgi:hypothetical protein